MTPQDLIEARLRLGLTQREMAEALLTPFPTYRNWEYGRGAQALAKRRLVAERVAQLLAEVEKETTS